MHYEGGCCTRSRVETFPHGGHTAGLSNVSCVKGFYIRGWQGTRRQGVTQHIGRLNTSVTQSNGSDIMCMQQSYAMIATRL